MIDRNISHTTTENGVTTIHLTEHGKEMLTVKSARACLRFRYLGKKVPLLK